MVGRLIYLIGPSGSGKDSLLDAARETLTRNDCRIVRRVITRSAEAVGEAAQAVSVEQFESMREQGAFALSWQANGLHYGIPVEIDQWLLEGHNVLMNGSRAHLQQAQVRYPTLLAVLLTVDQQVLRQRLLARGRESVTEIEARLERNASFAVNVLAADPSVFLLDNSGELQQTVNTLIRYIDSQREPA
ncbi:phosphonate metabolism protein/1,5-bisphosphokinase (PRPP-forming) PhnN [Pseudomonas capsici]|uniref:phosphonate metabolism protein/1,5-bisphosphokinase (PRPP-forming) PhnN n=1 Tax=Pseudomonas capsici TaxID=2810614 RepID=UPI0019110E55|nr:MULTISPECIES: phosphonate metabolism protein/1,5-bisphosphokinase (PRPP-forming) PhnN [Pseudomonas]MBX8611271.1 phosphonate metabolism protein/1,5-bisphosphokinase (PRPP-forming) PhnN [Pseudomonas cichorii]MCV4262677.1 phosphonate metabolism protein/1,5-bisphosphokinase (PRPP-forming) PhnN [Pseudomonas capsici]MCV4272866.1 phosphonate metabolism protein/1,5-bisphosphokinase (PRPP-forming) PhnN [Pseudomonas capsici]GFM55660.1 ribose 1,5-bisphosphate phosphokinase PhnN [Pseudomonas cichorii]G